MAMTTEQFQQKLRKQLRELKAENDALQIAANTGVALLVERVFEKGLDANNAKIGDYSEKEMYVNPDDSPRSFPPKGKHGDTNFKNGKPHKTRYFKYGYKQFRRSIGREHAFVNLRLTNDLQSDVSNHVIPPSSKSMPQKKDIKATKENANLYLIKLRPNNVKKIKGLEKKYKKKIFKHTEEEKKIIYDVAQFELFKRFNA